MNQPEEPVEPQAVSSVAESSIGAVVPRTMPLPVGPEGLELECREVLHEVTVRYEVYGRMNRAADNVILLLHPFSADAHAAGFHSGDPPGKTGWWHEMTGPGRPFDTRRFCVICSSVLGGCGGTTGPSSINRDTGLPWGPAFPPITIGDMVNVQRRLMDALGVSRLVAVAGGSMGGMQALEWAIRYPGFARCTIMLASTAALDAQALAFHAAGRRAVCADRAWNGGQYYGNPGGELPTDGLAAARMMGQITYLSAQELSRRFRGRGRGRGTSTAGFPAAERGCSDDPFAAGNTLAREAHQFARQFDANSYMYLTRAMDAFDPAAQWGSLDAAVDRIRGPVLILAYSSDWLFPPEQSREIATALARRHKDVAFHTISTSCGHDSFLLETRLQVDIIERFLQEADISTGDGTSHGIFDSFVPE